MIHRFANFFQYQAVAMNQQNYYARKGAHVKTIFYQDLKFIY